MNRLRTAFLATASAAAVTLALVQAQIVAGSPGIPGEFAPSEAGPAPDGAGHAGH